LINFSISCNKSLAFCQYNGFSINYLVIIKNIHDGECIQGIHFEDSNMYLTGNFGEIIYIKLSDSLMESDANFKQDMIKSGNLYLQNSKDFRKKEKQAKALEKLEN
jgi:hypothetical protein